MVKKVLTFCKKYEEIMNYLIVGVLTTAVSLLSKWLLLFTILDAEKAIQLQISIIISWICAVVFAYIANRVYVFKSKNKNILKESIEFIGSRLVTLFLEMMIMWLFVTLLQLNSDLWVIFWTVFTQIVIIVLNYVFSKIFVFRKTE